MLATFLNAKRAASDTFWGLKRLPWNFDRFEKLVFTAALSPIDQYVALNIAMRNDAIFEVSYAYWRIKRINKILEIYGEDFFRGKRILELGSGLSDIGAFFADLGAEVLCLEGRQETVRLARLKHRKVDRLRIEQHDLEQDFSRFGRFDLLIHFGLLYHIPDVDGHLSRCFAMADEIVLESVVCDSTNPEKIVLVEGNSNVIEECLHGTGSRPSPSYVERIAEENGFLVARHFTSDLNVDRLFVYDWEHKNDGNLGGWRNRRFWRFSRTKYHEGADRWTEPGNPSRITTRPSLKAI
ncbi:class I SAM-dependent methyltransferase [Enterovirga aerilata]|uniref:Methyltransferase type 12 domain-containing protein n=1 Tax=Enterovirga aerilata TaxID=2730920 RepID=A0A849HWW2_9HYPH|nr:class I SAM-dependent methyltransferase [Enterovirga sp. DB1703]NNM72026.1 hypothetical protein [Enterovirga sp. DB1703]